MCYWVGTKKVREEMERRFKEGPQDEIAQLFYKAFIENPSNEFKEHYVAIGKGKPQLSILTNESGNYKFKNVRWTLPFTYFDKRKGGNVTYELLNSMCEKVFRNHADIIYDKRCIVPINGYFEFYHFGGETYPHYIFPKKGIFYAGGIWKPIVNEKTGEIIDTLSILTTPPNPMVRQIHNNPEAPNGSRMLLLLPQDKIFDYLNPKLKRDQIESLFNPFDMNEMKAYPVIKFLKKENYIYANTPKVMEKYDYPELVA